LKSQESPKINKADFMSETSLKVLSMSAEGSPRALYTDFEQ
jgi:hypothetical protein